MRRALAAIGALAVALVFATAAQGAKVWVEEGTPEWDVGVAPAILHYEANPDEANHLTITVASEADGDFHLHLIDTGAEVHPGAGCAGGGVPGVATTCTVPMPLAPIAKECARPCGNLISRPGWETVFRVSLGNGGSFFDAADIPDATKATYGNVRPPATTRMEVTGGSGDDTISTAGGDDLIDPGTGTDHVSTHGGDDTIRATPAPDGPDFYDLGSIKEKNEVDYGLRTTPVSYDANSGIGGAPGEDDRISGARMIAGGSADDVLVGGPANEIFLGNAGNDELVGAAGDDRLEGGEGDNRLIGNGGSNSLEGGEGDDLAEGGSGADTFLLRGGDDVAIGGKGADYLWLGAGDDRGLGGPGNDIVVGDEGDDSINGNGGTNTLVGGAGQDQIIVGSAADTVLAGTETAVYEGSGPTNFRDPKGRLETWRDTIECHGLGAKVSLNPWDLARGCKTRALVRAVEVGALHENPRTGAARLILGVRNTGKVELFGSGVRSASTMSSSNARLNYRPFSLPVAPIGGALQQLRSKGEVTLHLKLRFSPKGGKLPFTNPGGPPRERSTTVRLTLGGS